MLKPIAPTINNATAGRQLFIMSNILILLTYLPETTANIQLLIASQLSSIPELL